MPYMTRYAPPKLLSKRLTANHARQTPAMTRSAPPNLLSTTLTANDGRQTRPMTSILARGWSSERSPSLLEGAEGSALPIMSARRLLRYREIKNGTVPSVQGGVKREDHG